MSQPERSLTASDVHEIIRSLTQNLINIKDTSGEFLLRLSDGRVIDTKSWNGWDWTHGIGLYGLWNYYTLTGRADIRAILTEWFDAQLEHGTSKNINTMAAFLTLAYLYEETGERRYRPWLEEWAEWAMYDLPRTPFGGMQHVTYDLENVGELWDDTLMMTVMPLAKIGQVLRRPHYVDEAKRQFLLHAQCLFDPSSGLRFHGWKFDDLTLGLLGHNFARARWARGNAWVTMAVPEFLELLDLPSGDPFRLHLIGILEAQCQTLRSLQSGTGLWRTLLDISEEEGSYPESSATAGFIYGILKAVRCRYISKDYRAMALRAMAALTRNIDSDGELHSVSFGTPVGSTLQHYKDIPQTAMPYGQAMATMACVEYLRTFI